MGYQQTRGCRWLTRREHLARTGWRGAEPGCCQATEGPPQLWLVWGELEMSPLPRLLCQCGQLVTTAPPPLPYPHTHSRVEDPLSRKMYMDNTCTHNFVQLGLHSQLLFHLQDVVLQLRHCGGRRGGGFAEAEPCLGIFPEVPGWRNSVSAPRQELKLCAPRCELEPGQHSRAHLWELRPLHLLMRPLRSRPSHHQGEHML